MGTPISGLAALTEGAKGDLIEIIDISDTSMSPNGTNKKIQTKYIIGRERIEKALAATTGWYTIAQIGQSVNNGTGTITVQNSAGNALSCNVSFRNGTNAKTHINNTIELLSSSANIGAAVSEIESFRIAKSDSVKAGAKIQVYIDTAGSRDFIITLNNNAIEDGDGIELVDPTLENSPTLPDGITSSTFLEAGEELSFDHASGSFVYNQISGHKIDNDTMAVVVQWDQIPKQNGTSISLVVSPASLTFVDGTNTSSAVSASYTISNFEVLGKRVLFRINDTGAFSGLTTGRQSSGKYGGTGGKFTIT